MKRFDRLIFVSNSDTCRAPMAKGIMRSKYLLSDLEVDSSKSQGGRGLVVLFFSGACKSEEGFGRAEWLCEKHNPRA